MIGSNLAVIEKIVSEVVKRIELQETEPHAIVGVSNRHVHLSEEDIEVLFGPGYQLTKMKDLMQPGQYAAKETITLIGPKGKLERTRVLGPPRAETQVEVSVSDSFILGLTVSVRESGKTAGTPGIILQGPMGTIQKDHGVIAALRHIHMPPDFARQHGFKDKELVSVEIEGLRKTVFHNVLIRVSDQFLLEMHVDTDEANASGVRSGDLVKIARSCKK